MQLGPLLDGAAELSKLAQPRDVLELAVQKAAQWTGGRACSATSLGVEVGECPPGGLSYPLTHGCFSLDSQGLDTADLEVLQLWTMLVSAALERCQAQANLIQGSKLATIGQLTAGVAHELNTPLAALSLAIGVVAQTMEKRPERALSRLEVARKAVEHMRTIVAKLLNYSRDSGGEHRRTEVGEIVRDSVQLVDQTFQLERIELSVESEPDIWVLVNSAEIQQVLVNLLNNGRHAVRGQELPRVLLSARRLGQVVQMEVNDNGPGVEEEAMKRIFEPFFTTRDVGQGVGLGLSISREIVTKHGGQLECSRGPLGGACFCLTLPVFEED